MASISVPASGAARLDQLADAIGELAPGLLQRERSLAPLTSFQIGGAADLFFDPPSLAALSGALREAHRREVPVTVLGGGTNLLVSDAGVRGLVVHLGKAFSYLRWLDDERPEPERSDARLEAGAGARMIRTAKAAVERGYGGLEFAAGIPGSVGGAVLMNAGAFGGEISEAVEALETVDLGGEVCVYAREQLAFSYRKLALDRGLVVTSVRFRLLRSSVGRLQEAVARVQAKRRRNQPSGFPNAGSIFKNPPNEYAGRLIERVGLKGKAVGAAQVSPDHANFIVNLGGAKAEDVRVLMGLIQDEVWKKCGIWLEPEVRLVGEWG